MSKHTPGPWVWIERRGAAFLVAEADRERAMQTPSNYAIADDGSAYGEYGQCINPNSANAKLIASAPDLLDVVQGLVDLGIDERFLNESWPELAKVLADAKLAAAKARGES